MSNLTDFFPVPTADGGSGGRTKVKRILASETFIPADLGLKNGDLIEAIIINGGPGGGAATSSIGARGTTLQPHGAIKHKLIEVLDATSTVTAIVGAGGAGKTAPGSTSWIQSHNGDPGGESGLTSSGLLQDVLSGVKGKTFERLSPPRMVASSVEGFVADNVAANWGEAGVSVLGWDNVTVTSSDGGSGSIIIFY